MQSETWKRYGDLHFAAAELDARADWWEGQEQDKDVAMFMASECKSAASLLREMARPYRDLPVPAEMQRLFEEAHRRRKEARQASSPSEERRQPGARAVSGETSQPEPERTVCDHGRPINYECPECAPRTPEGLQRRIPPHRSGGGTWRLTEAEWVAKLNEVGSYTFTSLDDVVAGIEDAIGQALGHARELAIHRIQGEPPRTTTTERERLAAIIDLELVGADAISAAEHDGRFTFDSERIADAILAAGYRLAGRLPSVPQQDEVDK